MKYRFNGARVCGCLVIVGQLIGITATAKAQERPRAAIDLTGGWVGFGDDGVVSESLVGGTGRWYLHPRISIGPEILYLQGDGHNHVVVTGNLTCDLLRETNQSRITPFLVVGGGMFQTRTTFAGSTVTSREGAFTAGGGLRARVGDRLSVGIDARVGWELHVRVGGFVGVRLGR